MTIMASVGGVTVDENSALLSKDLAAAVQAIVKSSKAKSAADKRKATKKAYAAVAKRNPLLRAAMADALKKLGIG